MGKPTIKAMQLLKRSEVVELLANVPERSQFPLEFSFHACLTLEELTTGYQANLNVEKEELFIPARIWKPARYIRLAKSIVHRLDAGFRAMPGEMYFHLPDGRPFTVDQFRHDFDVGRRRIGRPNLAYEDLRWTSAAFLIEAGVRDVQVAGRLGVSNDAVRNRFTNSSENDLSILTKLEHITLG